MIRGGGDMKKIRTRILSILLFALLLICTAINLPTAQAAEATPPVEEPQPTETAQPSETTESASTEASESSGPTEEPEIIEVDGQECINGEVIVKFDDHVSDGAIISTLDAADSGIVQELPTDNTVVSEVPEGETVESFIDSLEDQPGVECAQPNYVYTLDKTVNDPDVTRQWYLDKINVYNAWDITTGSSSIRVAVLDTGIDLDHPEFAGRIYAQTDVVDNDGSAEDDDGHGTHVAGIIAANADNGTGIAGIAPNVQLIIVDVFGPDNSCTTDAIEGVYYAMNHGASVINMSFGGYQNDQMLEAALQTATDSGIVCVTAAGNDNTDAPSYPSDYDSVISVIATTSTDVKADYSNYGDAKDISAPGSSIYSTFINGDGYASMSGTSMAAPMVSGVVALMRSANPGLSVSAIKDILYSTAVDLGDPGRDNQYGYGRVDVYQAVKTADEAGRIHVSVTATGYGSVTVSWNAAAGASGYKVYRAAAGGAYSLVKTTSATGFSDSGLKTGTTYSYKVRPYTKVNRTTTLGDESNIASATPMLSSVTTAAATAYYPTKIKVSWSAVPGRTRYEVWRSEDGGAYTMIGTTTKTYYTSANLTPFKTYSYYIRVYRTVNRQPVYAAAASPVASATPVLGDVANVKASVASVTSVKLTWSGVTGASGYEVLRWDEASGQYTVIASTTRKYYYDKNLIPNQAYNYEVRAYCTVGATRVRSAACSPVSAMPVFGSVANPGAVRYSSTKIKLTWTAVSGRSGYEVCRATAIDGEYVLIGSTTRTYFTDSGLTTGTPYYYMIRAYVTVNGIRQYSAYSAVVTATP